MPRLPCHVDWLTAGSYSKKIFFVSTQRRPQNVKFAKRRQNQALFNYAYCITVIMLMKFSRISEFKNSNNINPKVIRSAINDDLKRQMTPCRWSYWCG